MIPNLACIQCHRNNNAILQLVIKTTIVTKIQDNAPKSEVVTNDISTIIYSKTSPT